MTWNSQFAALLSNIAIVNNHRVNASVFLMFQVLPGNIGLSRKSSHTCTYFTRYVISKRGIELSLIEREMQLSMHMY